MHHDVRYAMMHNLVEQHGVAIQIYPASYDKVEIHGQYLWISDGKEMLPTVKLDSKFDLIHWKLHATYGHCIFLNY